jgi:hypothetical protein
MFNRSYNCFVIVKRIERVVLGNAVELNSVSSRQDSQTATNGGGTRPARSVTIPIHGGREIGPPLFHQILDQLGIDEKQFARGFGKRYLCDKLSKQIASV